jgi:hypothetical protein
MILKPFPPHAVPLKICRLTNVDAEGQRHSLMDEYRSSHSVRTVTRSRHTDYAVHWHALERRRSLVHLLGGGGNGGNGWRSCVRRWGERQSRWNMERGESLRNGLMTGKGWDSTRKGYKISWYSTENAPKAERLKERGKLHMLGKGGKFEIKSTK